MTFEDGAYDPPALRLLARALDEAWEELQRRLLGGEQAGDTTKKLMAMKIIDAANGGERDLERLKAHALCAVEGRQYG